MRSRLTLARLSLAITGVVLACSGAAHAQQSPLAALASTAPRVPAPRYVNIGNEIIQSQTARPVAPCDLPALPAEPEPSAPHDQNVDAAVIPDDAAPGVTSAPAAAEDVDPRLTSPYAAVVTAPRGHARRPGPVPGNPGDNPAYWPNYTRPRIIEKKRGG